VLSSPAGEKTAFSLLSAYEQFVALHAWGLKTAFNVPERPVTGIFMAFSKKKP
jgi:hypothetical protein